MQWWKGDAELLGNDKVVELDSPEALLLWFVGGISCSAAETDGVIKPGRLRTLFASAYIETRQRQNKAIKRLVTVRLWHDHNTVKDCEECSSEFGDLEDGSFCMHNWNDWQPTRDDKTDPAKAFKANRKRRLKKLLALKEQIRRRDRGYCRYCGIRVKMHDHTSENGHTYDHVDPEQDNSLDNVVTSCRGCNGFKRDRLPAEAGMRLLPVPEPGVAPVTPPGSRPYLDEPGEPGAEQVPASTQASSEQGPEQVPAGSNGVREPGSEQVPASRSAQLGTEPARSLLGAGLGNRLGSAPVRSGTALLGAARSGSVGFGSARVPPTGGSHPPPDLTDSDPFSTEDPNS